MGALHDELVVAAKAAIDDVQSDMSVSQATTAASLRELEEQAGLAAGTIEEEIEQDAKDGTGGGEDDDGDD